MTALIAKLKQNPLIKNSSIFFVGTMVVNVGNFFFHLMMSRMLDVKTFGEFEALISLMYIISVPAATLMTMVTKYSSEFHAADEKEKIGLLFTRFTKVLLFWGIVLFVLFALASPLIAQFLKLDSFWPVVILGTIILVSFLEAINGGILNGLQKFFAMSVLGGVTVLLKITFAFVFIKLAFELSGAIGALSLAIIVGYFINLSVVRRSVKFGKGELTGIKEMFFYLFPTFVILLCLVFYYSIDVVLVKYFFSPELAGQYGAVSIIGRIIFFVTGAVVAVMFPMLAKAKKDRSHHKLFRNTAIIIFGVSLIGVVGYFLFPKLIITILVGSKYHTITPYIGWFGLAMLFYALINMLSRYFLANKNFKSLYIFVSGLVLQVALICFFHSSLAQIVLMMNISLFVILLALTIYYLWLKEYDGQESENLLKS